MMPEKKLRDKKDTNPGDRVFAGNVLGEFSDSAVDYINVLADIDFF